MRWTRAGRMKEEKQKRMEDRVSRIHPESGLSVM